MDMCHVLSPLVTRRNNLKQRTLPRIDFVQQFFEGLFLICWQCLSIRDKYIKDVDVLGMEESSDEECAQVPPSPIHSG